jgi:hypothetical protein
MSDDDLDPMSIEGLDARLVNVETILPDLFDMYELRAAGGPYYWAALDPDEAVKLWDELGKFVTWLDGRYITNLADPSYRLPDCWYRHPIAIEELTGLMVSHRAAYDTRSAKASSARVDWHQRALWPALDSLKDTPEWLAAATAANTANPTPGQRRSTCPPSTCTTST